MWFFTRSYGMRKIIALRHTNALPSGDLAPDAMKYIVGMAPVIAAIGATFAGVIVSTSARARQTAELLLGELGVNGLALDETPLLDPPPDESKKGVAGADTIVAAIKSYREQHPTAGVATSILASPNGERYLRRKGAALLPMIKERSDDILIVAHENGVTALALEAVGMGYHIDVLGGDFRFVEGVCLTLDDNDIICETTILRNPAYNS